MAGTGSVYAPEGTYADYVSQYNSNPAGPSRPPDAGWHPPVVAPKKKPPRRPGAPGTLAQLLAMLPGPDSYGPLMSEDDIRARAKADAMAILGPLLDRENSDYQARLSRGSDAITGYTKFFQDRLGGVGSQVQGLYDRQQGITAGLGDALAGAQGHANEGGINSLSAALTAMNAPHAEGTVDQQTALSAGGTRLTKTLSATELQRLANEGTAQESFAALQPGIAALEGGQNLRDYLSTLNDQRASALADINGQVPSLTQSLYSQYYGANEGRRSDRAAAQSAKAQLAASWLGSQADRDQEAGIFGVKTAAQQSQFNQTLRFKIQQENHRTALALQKLNAQAATLDEQIAHNRAIENNAHASLAERKRAAQMREAQEKARRSIANRKQIEQHRHNAAVEAARKNSGLGSIVISGAPPTLPTS